MPAAVTEKVAVCPTVTSTLAGGVAMEGGADVPRLLLLLVVVLALVRPAHPANNRPPERMANERNLIFCVNFEGMDLNI